MDYSIKKVNFKLKKLDNNKIKINKTLLKIYIDDSSIICKIIGFLGYGTVGQVYLLEPIVIKKKLETYVIKISNEDLNEDLILEIKQMKKYFTKHNINYKVYPLYYGSFKNTKSLGVIFPFVGYYNLDSIRTTKKIIPFNDGIHIIKELINQLKQLKNIIHCDLKPANIVIDEYNEPTIIDFGLANLNNANINILSTCYITSPESLLTLDEYNDCLPSNYMVDLSKHDNYGLFSIIINLFTNNGYWEIISKYLTLTVFIDNKIFFKSEAKEYFVYTWYKFFYKSINDIENPILQNLIMTMETYYPTLKRKNFYDFDTFYDTYIIKNINNNSFDINYIEHLRKFIKDLIHFDYNKRLNIHDNLNYKLLS